MLKCGLLRITDSFRLKSYLVPYQQKNKQKAHLHKTWLSADSVIKETSSPKAVLRHLPEEHFCFHKCFHKPFAALMGHIHTVLFFCLKDGT